MRALSIRQPYAELILRGIKRIEYRSRPTRIVGERFWIYASKKRVEFRNPRCWAACGHPESSPKPEARIVVADNIVVPAEPPPPWMVELANAMRLFPYE